MKQPLERRPGEDTRLRDELAVDRTSLANERTLLAYLRSGIALVLAGVTFIHFSLRDWFAFVGVLCVVIGVAALVLGAVRYRITHRHIDAVRKRLASPLCGDTPSTSRDSQDGS